jgi:hypothetical protein
MRKPVALVPTQTKQKPHERFAQRRLGLTKLAPVMRTNNFFEVVSRATHPARCFFAIANAARHPVWMRLAQDLCLELKFKTFGARRVNQVAVNDFSLFDWRGIEWIENDM